MSWRDSMPENYQNMNIDDYSGVLPVGIADDEGTIHRIVRFRPVGIIGEDEHAMADPKYKNNGTKALTALFSNGLVRSIGSLPVDENLIRRLSGADRDYLLLRARQITFGNKMEFDHACPNSQCNTVNTIVIEDLDEEIEVKYLPDECERDNDGIPIFHSTFPVGIEYEGEIHKDYVFRLPTGAESERLTPIANSNLQKANTALMQYVIKNIGPVKNINAKIIANMSARDRSHFVSELAKVAPGPKFRVEATCAGCGMDMTILIPTSAFLSE